MGLFSNRDRDNNYREGREVPNTAEQSVTVPGARRWTAVASCQIHNSRKWKSPVHAQNERADVQ